MPQASATRRGNARDCYHSCMTQLPVRVEVQRSGIADEVSALTAVVRPILEGVLYALKGDVVAAVGGHDKVTLELLARLYRPGDRDCGICFEWAVHDALNNGQPQVLERVDDALVKYCKVPGSAVASILFGAEKGGAVNLIDTARQRLTDESRVLVGRVGQPPKLRNYINLLAAALRRPEVRTGLPNSISGLWKADLFVGHEDADRWVGTTVKLNPRDLEAARGLRIGLVPMSEGRSDAVRFDERRNLVVCPLPHDGAFMEIFYKGWEVVRYFIQADAHVPREQDLPSPASRQVARRLAERRKSTVLDVVDSLAVLAQPELLDTIERSVVVEPHRDAARAVNTVLAPQPASSST